MDRAGTMAQGETIRMGDDAAMTDSKQPTVDSERRRQPPAGAGTIPEHASPAENGHHDHPHWVSLHQLEQNAHRKKIPADFGSGGGDSNREGLLPVILGCGGLALLLAALIIGVAVQVFHRSRSKDRRSSNPAAGTKDSVLSQTVAFQELVHGDVSATGDALWRIGWDFQEKISLSNLPINDRIPQLKDWDPPTVTTDPVSKKYVPVAPKESRIVFQGDITIFSEIMIRRGEYMTVQFHYFSNEKTGYTVWFYNDGSVKVSQDRMAVNRDAQRAFLKAVTAKNPRPLKYGEWFGIEVDVAAGRVFVYVDSVLRFEGVMPKKWLVDQNDPAYLGGLPGKDFGENPVPPDFGSVVFNAQAPAKTNQVLIRYIQITGRPTDAWIEQNRKTYLLIQHTLSNSKTFVPMGDSVPEGNTGESKANAQPRTDALPGDEAK